MGAVDLGKLSQSSHRCFPIIAIRGTNSTTIFGPVAGGRGDSLFVIQRGSSAESRLNGEGVLVDGFAHSRGVVAEDAGDACIVQVGEGRLEQAFGGHHAVGAEVVDNEVNEEPIPRLAPMFAELTWTYPGRV